MSVSVIPIPLSSPLFPLPADYGDLTVVGQRLARVNGARQWLVPCSPQEHRTRSVLSHNFFDLCYLHPTDTNNPGFYDTEPLPRPLFHDHMVGDWHTYNRTIQVFPRGSGKTKRDQADMAHRLITCPNYSFVYSTSSDSLALKSAGTVREQCYNNSRINDDFGPEPDFDGALRPVRGDRATGVELFYLSNGSWLRSISIAGKMRGDRPRRFRLDDPEWDPAASTSMMVLRETLERQLFTVIMPMVIRSGCGLDWTGTFITKRHFLWRAMSVKDSPSGPVAEDPRFDMWARTSMHAGHETGDLEADGKTPTFVSAWPEMWPGSIAQKRELNLPPDTLTLGQLRDVLGVHVFNPEYLGRPGDEGSAYFPPLTDELHGYTLTNFDTLFTDDPRQSTTRISWHRRTTGGVEPVSMPLSEFLHKSRIFMCLDHADTSHAGSDAKTVCLMAHLPVTNELFVLDLFSTRRDRSEQIRTAFEWADRWRCPSVHPEVVKTGVVLYTDLQDKARTRSLDVTGTAFVPTIKPIRPGMEAKTDKIASLFHRFEHGLIKLPLHLRSREPWRALFQQIEEFNPHVNNGGLSNDDELDTVSMSKFILKSRTREDAPQGPARTDASSLLSKSVDVIPGLPVLHGCNLQDIDPSVIAARLNAYVPPTEENRI